MSGILGVKTYKAHEKLSNKSEQSKYSEMGVKGPLQA